MIRIYTAPDCPRCEEVKKTFDWVKISYEVIELAKVLSGEIKDHGALTQLAMQNMAAPVVIRDDGTPLSLEDIASMLGDEEG